MRWTALSDLDEYDWRTGPHIEIVTRHCVNCQAEVDVEVWHDGYQLHILCEPCTLAALQRKDEEKDTKDFARGPMKGNSPSSRTASKDKGSSV